MDGLKIVWTATAIKQRNYIFEYWNSRNKSKRYSKKLNLKIKERLSLLSDFPNVGKPTDNEKIRGISLGHYSIFYKTEKSAIIIIAFWDNRQKLEKLLQFLKES